MSIDPVRMEAAKSFIIAKAKRMCRRPGFNSSHQPDIEQELWRHLVTQLPKFDPNRRWEKFVSFILDKKCISIWRDRFAEMRSPDREECSLNDPVLDADGRVVDRHQTTAEATKAWQRRHDLATDVIELRSRLPTENHRQVMDALARGASINSIANELGVPWSTAAAYVEDITQVFGDAGMREYL